MFLTLRSCSYVQGERKVLVDKGPRSGSLWCWFILCPTLTTLPLFHWCPNNLPSCSMETLTVNKTHAVRFDCLVHRLTVKDSRRDSGLQNSVMIFFLSTSADGADGALSPQPSCHPPPVAPPPWVGPVVCSQPLRSLSPPDGLENPAEERPNVRWLFLIIIILRFSVITDILGPLCHLYICEPSYVTFSPFFLLTFSLISSILLFKAGPFYVKGERWDG